MNKDFISTLKYLYVITKEKTNLFRMSYDKVCVNLQGELKKVHCLMERSMKTRSSIPKIGIVLNLQGANLNFDPENAKFG